MIGPKPAPIDQGVMQETLSDAQAVNGFVSPKCRFIIQLLQVNNLGIFRSR